MLALLAPRGPLVGASEEAAPRLVKIPQRLLLDRLTTRCEPRLRCPGLGQLPTLRHVTRGGSTPWAPFKPLLQAEVPHEPGVCAVLAQNHFLLWGRIKAVAGHPNILAKMAHRRQISRGDGGMSARPRLLDLYCKQGGATKGYQRAGFYVIGVDIEPQPLYCGDEFHQMNALDLLAMLVEGEPFYPEWAKADAIHASPPCQHFTAMSNRWRGAGGKADSHPDLLWPTRFRLRATGLPYVLKNVPAAKKAMSPTLMLHGGMFGLGVDRPRIFESNVLLLAPRMPATKNPVGVYGKAPDGRLLWARADGTEQRAARSVEEARQVMGMPWADWDGCREAIPPAYTEFIGTQLLEYLRAAA